MEKNESETITDSVKSFKAIVNNGKSIKLLETMSSDLQLEKVDSTSNVQVVVNEIVSTKISSLFSSVKLPGFSRFELQDNMWRGWILCSETVPIALLTTDTPVASLKSSLRKSHFLKLDSFKMDSLVLDRLAAIASNGKESVPVLPVEDVKIKTKRYSLSDLNVYGTTLRQTSGASLFEKSRREGKCTEPHEEIIDKYGLPNVYKEEGLQASATKLRIFRATVTNKKGMCSLSKRSRERLFLMFSPSDENMQDVINNVQIKTKLLRHEINTFSNPKTKREGKSDELKNAPFYMKRTLPPLKCVTDSGPLKNLPPLTIELIYDLFFNETEIEKDGYTVLIKNQPLLVENITLTIIPKLTTPLILEKKKAAFTPRYSQKDREGEKATPIEEEIKKVKKVKAAKEMPVVEPERSDPLVVQSIIEGTLATVPQLKDDLDMHLSKLTNHLKDKSKVGDGRTRKKTKSQWNAFERSGHKVKITMNQIRQTHEQVEQNTIDDSVKSDDQTAEVDEKITVESYPSKPRTSIISKPEAPAEKSSMEQILDQVVENKEKLKKVVIIPPVKPKLPQCKSTGRKRFFMKNMQQYWAEYHTNTNTFFHNPIKQVDFACDSPIINELSRMRPPPPAAVDVDFVSGENIEDEGSMEQDDETSSHDMEITQEKPQSDALQLSVLPPIITVREVDEIKHELGTPKYTYSENKNKYAGLAPSTYYKHSKKEIVTFNFFDRFLKNFYTLNNNRRKLFIFADNELGVQKIVSTTIKPSNISYKELDTWQNIAKFVSQNVTFIPLKNPLFLPHFLSSPSVVLERGFGHAFELSTLLSSLLIGQGYDAFVVSGYANILLTVFESSRNYLRHECPYLVNEGPSDPYGSFSTNSYVAKTRKGRMAQKCVTNYYPSVQPYLDSNYLLQTKLDIERTREEEMERAALEEEDNAYEKYLSQYEKDDLEGQRIHSWVLVLKGKRQVQKNFFIEPSSGFAYEVDDPHYHRIESLWNHLNYWIYRGSSKRLSAKIIINQDEPISTKINDLQRKKVDFDLTNSDIWLPILVNGPQVYMDTKNRRVNMNKILRIQKSLDMPDSWCGRISITPNQVESRINVPFRTSFYNKSICHEYKVGMNDDGLVAKVICCSDLLRTDPEYEIKAFEKRKDMMYRRRRDVISDKLTEYFSFGRNDCLKSHEFIDGADAMYCDHNMCFYWDFRNDGLSEVHMTDLYLELDYRGRQDNLSSIFVLYGSAIEEKKKKKRNTEFNQGKTPRKEIQTIIHMFAPSPEISPWKDFAKITYRLNKSQIVVDYQYEGERITISTKSMMKSSDDTEVNQVLDSLARNKKNTIDDEDCLSELDYENFDKNLDQGEQNSEVSSDDQMGSSIKSNFSRSSKRYISKKSNASRSSKMSQSKQLFKDTRKSKSSIPKSDESIASSRSSASDGSFGLSEPEYSIADENSRFFPAQLTADRDKSLWACSRKTKLFLGRKLMHSNLDSNSSGNAANNLTKMGDFDHLTKDSSTESDEGEDRLKEIRKRQLNAVEETNELYKAIEKDKMSPYMTSIAGRYRNKKYDVCRSSQIVDIVNNALEEKKIIHRLQSKLLRNSPDKSTFFPEEQVENADEKKDDETAVPFQIDTPYEEETSCVTTNVIDSETELRRKDTANLKKNKSDFSTQKNKKSNLTVFHEYRNFESAEDLIDPLVMGVYRGSGRCIEDSNLLRRRKSQSSSKKGKVRRIVNSVKKAMFEDNEKYYSEGETQLVSTKKEYEGTLSEEEAANEKDVDSDEGDVYNSDDNYSLQSRYASSGECSSSDIENQKGIKPKEEYNCQSENEFVIEYQTEAPQHDPYDFQGFHFQAGKMYARKLYQIKEVCDTTVVDSDVQSSYEGDEDYKAEFLQGEIDKFLENTVDKITRDAKSLIGGLKKISSETNFDPTGVYYCHLSDKYISYVDSYFKKINRKRELQTDKALFMEFLKQKAKEPDKIINHIREYVIGKKNGLNVKLDDDLMNLIPHVRPLEAKKKDRLGYEILTDDDDDDEEHNQVGNGGTEQKEGLKESIDPVIVTTTQLANKIVDPIKTGHFLDAVNNFRKFKDMETVNQLIDLPLHECFSDVNIRTHLQSARVNDGYFIDTNIDGHVIQGPNEENLDFVTVVDQITLSKDAESSQSEEEQQEDQETKVERLEDSVDAEFFEAIYSEPNKPLEHFKPKKFRMFAPLNPSLLDSDSDGSINAKIREKRRKALGKNNGPCITCSCASPSLQKDVNNDTSQVTDTQLSEELKLVEKQQNISASRIKAKNSSRNDAASELDKCVLLEQCLIMEDEAVTYVRNIEAYLYNLLLLRKKERSSFRRNLLGRGSRGIRRRKISLLNEKLIEYAKTLNDLSFEWDTLGPYLHLLLPQDTEKKFTYETARYMMRVLIIDFIERQLFRMKGWYETYDKVRQRVVKKKNMFVSQLEDMSLMEKSALDDIITNLNESLRREADQAHILHFIILREAKNSTKKFLKLIESIKKDERINHVYNEAKERLIVTNLAKRWPEQFEFIKDFSGLPVASEQNDFTTSYISPVDDIIIRKITKLVRKKPPKYLLPEDTYHRYVELMERDRDYFDGLRKKMVREKSLQSHLTEISGFEVENEGKYSEFILKKDIVNDIKWSDYLFNYDSEEIIHGGFLDDFLPDGFQYSFQRSKSAFAICTTSVMEEIAMIRKLETTAASDRSGYYKSASSIDPEVIEASFKEKDRVFLKNYGSPEAAKAIRKDLPEYFEYI